MRKLKTTDLFKLSKIYKKMDIKLNVEAKMSQTEVGAKLINELLSNFYKAEKEIIELISDLKGVSVEEVEEYGLIEIKDVFKDLLELEGLNDFLQTLVA